MNNAQPQYAGAPPQAVPAGSYAQPYPYQPSYVPVYRPAPKTPYTFGKGDAAFAFVLIVVGFLFWEWLLPKEILKGQYYEVDYFTGGVSVPSGLGISLLIFTLAGVSLVYMHVKGIRQNRWSLFWLAALLVGAFPFLLYQHTAIYAWLVIFEIATFAVWIAYSTGNLIGKKLTGFLFFDGINQLIPVAIGNFTGLFRSLHNNTKERQGGKRFLVGLIGVIVCLPIIAGIVALLYAADAGFEELAKKIAEVLRLENIWRYCWETAVGLPVACYFYGILYGNAHKRKVGGITEEGVSRSIAGAHKIPAAAVHAPIIVLCVIYVLFFVGMGAYLFSAFRGDLPGQYSYAEYARRGFFELCAVGAINLGVVGSAWWFAKRGQAEYPKKLRLFGGLLSGLTILLVLTGMSKMLLYIGEWGLTRSRFHALWFMVLLLCFFAILTIWHLRPFNAGRPFVGVVTVLILTVFLVNADSVVAKYNVEAYLDRGVRTASELPVDLELLTNLSDAKYPYIERLAEEAPDADVRAMAADYLAGKKIDFDPENTASERALYGDEYVDELSDIYFTEAGAYGVPDLNFERDDIPYTGWNLQSEKALDILGM
jgi:hypothetical protein